MKEVNRKRRRLKAAPANRPVSREAHVTAGSDGIGLCNRECNGGVSSLVVTSDQDHLPSDGAAIGARASVRVTV